VTFLGGKLREPDVQFAKKNLQKEVRIFYNKTNKEICGNFIHATFENCSRLSGKIFSVAAKIYLGFCLHRSRLTSLLEIWMRSI
jgi:hypothetical protein